MLAEEDYPFLVLEVVYSESDEYALEKAKDYIKHSQGKIIYVIVVSVHLNKDNLGSARVRSEELSTAEVQQSTASSSSSAASNLVEQGLSQRYD